MLVVMMIVNVNVRAVMKRGTTRVGITAAVPSVLALLGMVCKAMMPPPAAATGLTMEDASQRAAQKAFT